MTTKIEVLWSPMPNRFISWGSDIITLYEEKPIKEAAKNAIKVSNTCAAEVVATISNQHYVKSLDVSPKADRDLLLALGLSSGKIKIATFGRLEWDPQGSSAIEIGPKFARQCNTVAFNPVQSNLLVSALDKYKQDHCVSIWDINRISTEVNKTGPTGQLSPSADGPKPTWELGMSEHCQNIVWFHNNCNILAAGMNMKHIRIFDIRDMPRTVSSTMTKAAFGVCTNPKDDKYLASYIESQIFIWDTRNMEKPIQILMQNRPVLKLGWCPTKSSLLTCLLRESNVLTLFDIEHPIIGSEEVEPTVLQRVVNPKSPCQLTSFHWHPNKDNRLICVGPLEKNVIIDHQVYDRMALACTPWFELVWPYGRKLLKSIDTSKILGLQNVTVKMKDRARSEYGLKPELYKNAEMVKDDEVLSNVWNWLHLSSQLVQTNKVASPAGNRHPGVLDVLNIDEEKNPSETATLTWSELGHHNCAGSINYYKHDDRNKALMLCCWPTDRDSEDVNDFITTLEKAGAYTRAAAIAVFTLKVQLAIDILSRAPFSPQYESSLNVVAMALSGFSDDSNSVWRKFCSSSANTLTDPYLKAMFSFLTADNKYNKVLNESKIAVDDRIALACMFLSDAKLKDYLKKLKTDLCNEGNLDGLLLIGNNPQGLILLQKYLDATTDIQSTALIAVRAFSHLINLPVVQHWILNYQTLLNQWKLWFERCDFDIEMQKYKKEKPPPQINLVCTYCAKNISDHLRNLRSQSRLNVTGSSFKLTGCPNCRKPLPKCTICLMYLGTSIDDEESEGGGGPIDSWFTWCQQCRHGGHAKHITTWFTDHLECPHVGCTCRCFSLDYVVNPN